jgi:transcriptional regulator with XRE-family HTH domain
MSTKNMRFFKQKKAGTAPRFMYTGGMTLRQLLRQYGITRSSELAHRLGISRQHAHLFWQGKRLPNRQMITRMHEATGIPEVALFLASRPSPQPQPRGRPRKRREGEAKV